MSEKNSLGALLVAAEMQQKVVEAIRPSVSEGSVLEPLLQKAYESFNAIVIELLRRHLSEVALRLDPKKGDWESEHAILQVHYGGIIIRIRVQKIKELDSELTIKVRKIMSTYTFKSFSRYGNTGELPKLQALYRRLTSQYKTESFWTHFMETGGWNLPEEVSLNLMMAITFKSEGLPDDFIVEVGKAFGYNFRFGFWRHQGNRGDNNHKTMKFAKELLAKDFALLYDQEFWAELSYFSESWVNRGQLFEFVGQKMGVVSIYAGHEYLINLPDRNAFSVSGGIPSQARVGTFCGDRWSGWYVVTDKGWQKYSEVVGQEAVDSLRWLILDNDGEEKLSCYDLHGLNFNFVPVTRHIEGVPLPQFYGQLVIDTGYADYVRALVTETGELLGLTLSVINYNGEGVRFTRATAQMQEAWKRSRIQDYLAENIVVKQVEEL